MSDLIKAKQILQQEINDAIDKFEKEIKFTGSIVNVEIINSFSEYKSEKILLSRKVEIDIKL